MTCAPLSVILGRAGQLEDGDYSSEETRKQALYIKNQALKLRELINDLNLFLNSKRDSTLAGRNLSPSVFFRQTIAAFLNNDPRTQYYQIETRIDPDIEKSTLLETPAYSPGPSTICFTTVSSTPRQERH